MFTLFFSMCIRTATFIVGKPNTSKSLFLSLDLLTGQMSAAEAVGAFFSGTRNRACSSATQLIVVSSFSSGSRKQTVFKVDGRFYSNLENCIKLAGVNSSFRNSSVFRQYAVDKSHERKQAFLEVDALLDHLFCHVRRFVTSNPLRPTSGLMWLPSDVKRTMVYILAVTTISGQ